MQWLPEAIKVLLDLRFASTTCLSITMHSVPVAFFNLRAALFYFLVHEPVKVTVLGRRKKNLILMFYVCLLMSSNYCMLWELVFRMISSQLFHHL